MHGLPMLFVRYEDLLMRKDETMSRIVDFMLEGGEPLGIAMKNIRKYFESVETQPLGGVPGPGYRPRQVLTVLYCIVLYCIVLCFIVFYCIVLYCIALHCSMLYCVVYCYIMSMCCVMLSSAYYVALSLALPCLFYSVEMSCAVVRYVVFCRVVFCSAMLDSFVVFDVLQVVPLLHNISLR